MKRFLVLLADYLYDLWRFRRYSAFGKDARKSPKLLQAQLMVAAHGLEKALSFQEFEPRRALRKVRSTLLLLEKHRELGLPENDVARCMAQDAVANYRRIHSEVGVDVSDVFADAEGLVGPSTAKADYSVRRMTNDMLTAAERAALIKGMKTRASIREYADTPINRTIVRAVVADSLSTPSVCNRQGFRVHYSLDPTVINAALSKQNGNAGFGERVPGLFIVTCSLGIFSSSSERNQAFVDGGLFAMSLMLAIHAHGMGACPLNWSASHRQDNALRRVLSIPEDEVVIMMMSFGPLPKVATAAGSRRYALEHFLTELELRI